jgi:hypothetical protein
MENSNDKIETKGSGEDSSARRDRLMNVTYRTVTCKRLAVRLLVQQSGVTQVACLQ